ncbi:MAG: hypothetical protein ACR2O7_01950 [Parasphingorhabdus sp.]
MNEYPYHIPVLSSPDLGLFRAPGPGLGNLLFPISRALIGQRANGGTFVFPTIRQIKIGPYLRREPDKRTYGDIFRSRSMFENRLWLRSLFLAKSAEGASAGMNNIGITYSGLGRQFHDLNDAGPLLSRYFQNISRVPVPAIDYDIAVHIRRGDFSLPAEGANVQNMQIELDWYKQAVGAAKNIIGNSSPRIIVFSDSNPASIIDELGFSNAQAEPDGNALTSMLIMAQARVLVGSRSTFSLWGQFFGDTIGIWPKDYQLHRYKPIDLNKDHFV